jgi:hypothetical protein
MADYDLYWVEKQEDFRNPKALAIEATGVLQAGIHLVARDILKSYMDRAIPYDGWHVIQKQIDDLVASSETPQAIFSHDAIIANANFRTLRELTSGELKTLDTLMEGIGFAPLRARQGE